MQRRGLPGELLDPQPGDAASATWMLECTATVSPDGVDVRGPYVQDRLGRRFVFLSWGTVDGFGGFTMFRRAKLMLDVIPQETLAAAAREGLLVGRLGLTGPDGGPVCARILPPRITWTDEFCDPRHSPRAETCRPEWRYRSAARPGFSWRVDSETKVPCH